MVLWFGDSALELECLRDRALGRGETERIGVCAVIGAVCWGQGRVIQCGGGGHQLLRRSWMTVHAWWCA